MANGFCNNCGAKLEPGLKFCTGCGAAVEAAPAPVAAPAPAPAQPAYTAPVQPAYSAPSQPVYSAPAPNPYVQPQAAVATSAPANTQPLSVGGFIGTLIVLCIPLVGFIMTIVWACSSSTNRNRKNLCIAYLILMGICLVLTIVLSIVFAGFWVGFAEAMGNSVYY